MAANNGRGRAGRPADFKYTDTVADKGTLQAILVKQDEIIDHLVQIAGLEIGAIVTNYNFFAVVEPENKESTAPLDNASAFFNASGTSHLVDIDPNLGSTVTTAIYTAAATSLLVTDVTELGTRGQLVRLHIGDGTNGAVFLATLPTTGNTITVSATAIVDGYALGVTVTAIASSIASRAELINKVDLKN